MKIAGQRAIVAGTLACFQLLCDPGVGFAGTFVESATIQHKGVVRYFDYYVPAELADSSVPLVFVLHGGTQSNDDVTDGPLGEFKRLAELEHFIVIYPNGTAASGQSGPSGNFNWNDCRTDAGPAGTPADDVGFISALIDWARIEFAVDNDRVYAVGPSNGGMMAYRLAFELSNRVAAVGAIIANLPANSECAPVPDGPVSVLIMNGTADNVMPWRGGQILADRGVVISAEATVNAWRSFLGTGAERQEVRLPDADPGDGGAVNLEIYCTGEAGSSICFYTVNGGGHRLPTIRHASGADVAPLLGRQNHDIEAATVVWRFFANHPKGGIGNALCGDGCVDENEQCDDGDTASGDCCSATCKFEGGDAACLADGSLCAVGACDGAAPASNRRRRHVPPLAGPW